MTTTAAMCSIILMYLKLILSSAQYNRNGDGFIDREELNDILAATGEPVTEEECMELMTDADLNKDNRLDFDGKTFTPTHTGFICCNGNIIHIHVLC
jgi:hypothetical protein